MAGRRRQASPADCASFVGKRARPSRPVRRSGLEKDLSEHGVVRNALAGEAGVSEGLVFSEEKGALYASPGADGVGAIDGWVPPERMQLLLGTDSAEGL